MSGANTLDVSDLVGIDYRAGAWSPTLAEARRPAADGGGADCWGLARLALQRMGIELPRTPAHGAAARAVHWECASGLPRVADVWLFEYRRGEGIEQHVGVVIPGRALLHTTANVGARVQTCAAIDRFYKVVGKYRYKGGGA